MTRPALIRNTAAIMNVSMENATATSETGTGTMTSGAIGGKTAMTAVNRNWSAKIGKAIAYGSRTSVR